ncbi:potassium-transporting ATPase subunit KdpC [Kineococcus sp. SYSU DK004]|uniref:potassium-transporting ATPase subunit KdpC n=1 Tax=Kineococcus sp. SYSU DK004 TaxID=3383125 RepID=UPI003D7CD439
MVLLLAATVVLGLLYPLAVFGVGRLVPARADGRLVEHDGRVVGSALLGQAFDGDEWFQPRPSVAGDGYDPLASGASNLGPSSAQLLATVEQRRAEVAARDGVAPADVAPDALTASGSGLDPDISPRYARQQVQRVARERGLDPAAVAALVEQHVQDRALGFLGAPRVGVLELNLALDRLAG